MQWWIVTSTEQELSGTMDPCVAPYGLMATSTADRAPVSFNKCIDEQQVVYCKAHPDQLQVSLSLQCWTFTPENVQHASLAPLIYLGSCSGGMPARRDAASR